MTDHDERENTFTPMPYRDIAVLLGVSYQRIQQLEKRALRKLRKMPEVQNWNRDHWESIADEEDERRRRTRATR